MKEYDVQGDSVGARHKHPSIKWYRAKHVAAMDDMEFHVAKPAIGADGEDGFKHKAKKVGAATAAGASVAATKTAEVAKKAWGVTALWAGKQNEKLKEAKLGEKMKGLFRKGERKSETEAEIDANEPEKKDADEAMPESVA